MRRCSLNYQIVHSFYSKAASNLFLGSEWPRNLFAGSSDVRDLPILQQIKSEISDCQRCGAASPFMKCRFGQSANACRTHMQQALCNNYLLGELLPHLRTLQLYPTMCSSQIKYMHVTAMLWA